MADPKEAQLLSFRDELKKLAWTPPAFLGPMGAGMGAGLGAGMALGGGIGAVRGYRQAQEQGQSGFGGALVGGLGGAQKGALIGAAAGGVGGGIAHALDPVKAEAMRAGLTRSSAFGRFGQRQVHALTGYTPEGGLKSLRMGAAAREPALGRAKKTLEEAKGGKDVRTLGGRLLGRNSVQQAEHELSHATKAHQAAQEAEQMGLTNVPGYVKSLATSPLKTMRVAANEQLAGTSTPMKALMLGVPAAQVVGAAQQDPNTRNAMGETRGEAFGSAAAGLATGTLMGPLPVASQMLLSNPIMHAGRRVGRVLDRGEVPPAPQQVGGVQ